MTTQNATATRPSRQRNPLPPVTGTCRWVEPFGFDPNLPNVGMVEINGRRYCLGRHDTYFLLIACEPDRQGKVGRYSIPRDLTTCECGDFTFRSDRRAAESPDHDGRCKHLKAIAKLIAAATPTATPTATATAAA